MRTLGDLDGMMTAGVRMNNTHSGLLAGGGWILVLHSTAILTRLPHENGEDRIIINMGGWPTPVTRDRLNRFLPGGLSVGQAKRQQVLHGLGMPPFPIPSDQPVELVSMDHGKTWRLVTDFPTPTPDKWTPTTTIMFNGVRVPVRCTIAHNPGNHPEGCPIVPNLYAVELVTEQGSRWWGFERASIDSHLRMRVSGYSPKNEIVMGWENALGDC